MAERELTTYMNNFLPGRLLFMIQETIKSQLLTDGLIGPLRLAERAPENQSVIDVDTANWVARGEQGARVLVFKNSGAQREGRGKSTIHCTL